MSTKNPNLPEFVTIESIKADLEAMDNNEAAWTPEWMTNALMSAWQIGNSAGDLSSYSGGLHKQYNPFMTEESERKEWYGI